MINRLCRNAWSEPLSVEHVNESSGRYKFITSYWLRKIFTIFHSLLMILTFQIACIMPHYMYYNLYIVKTQLKHVHISTLNEWHRYLALRAWTLHSSSTPWQSRSQISYTKFNLVTKFKYPNYYCMKVLLYVIQIMVFLPLQRTK